jgi:thiamine biosynthesis protein ThiS
VQISVNGESRDVPADTTVADLLHVLDLNVRHVAVEVNRELVPRATHVEHVLRQGDELEIVTLVGGG